MPFGPRGSGQLDEFSCSLCSASAYDCASVALERVGLRTWPAGYDRVSAMGGAWKLARRLDRTLSVCLTIWDSS